MFGIRGMGMDLISPDITKPWRETDCAIIDVNCPAGVTSDALAAEALAEAIPLGENGRIPCIMVLGGPIELFESVIARLEADGKKVGRVDSSTSIAGHGRFATQPGWPARIMALLLDPACEVLVTMARRATSKTSACRMSGSIGLCDRSRRPSRRGREPAERACR